MYLIIWIVKSMTTLSEEFADSGTEFPEVVFTETIAIPADCFNNFGLSTRRDGYIKYCLPSGIVGLMDCLSRESLVIIREYKKLHVRLSIKR